MKPRIAIIVIAVLAITGSLAAYYRSSGSTGAPQYTTAMAVRGDVVETVEATGTLGAVMTVQVGSQVSGTIKSLHADFNAIVRKGQVIARLDPSLFQAQVDQAENTPLVTAMASTTPTTTAAQRTSPLIPQPPGGNRQRSSAGGQAGGR